MTTPPPGGAEKLMPDCSVSTVTPGRGAPASSLYQFERLANLPHVAHVEAVQVVGGAGKGHGFCPQHVSMLTYTALMAAIMPFSAAGWESVLASTTAVLL